MMVARRKKWSEMSPAAQRTVVVVGLAEVVLTTVALVDLARRPAQQIRGAKPLWALGVFIQPVGPIAYLAFGRRPSEAV